MRDATRRQGAGEWVRHNAVLVMFVGLFVVLTFASDVFLTSRNLLNVLDQSAPLAIIACAGTLVIIAGGFDLSTGAIFGLASILAAWTTVHIDPTLAIFMAPLVGVLAGLANGIIIAGFGVHSFLATLATSLVFTGLAVLVSDGFLIPITADSFTNVGQGEIMGVPNGVVIFAVFAAVATLILRRTTFGRYVHAVGGSPEAAELSGVGVDRVRVGTFVLSGFAAGLAALVSVSKIASGEATAGAGLELQAIAAVILGGTSIYGGEGAVWRSVVGVLLLALINNGYNLLNADPFYRDLTTGVIIIFAVALAAQRRRRTRRSTRAAPPQQNAGADK